jgi:hypothetical protein
MLAAVTLSRGNLDRETPKAYGLDVDRHGGLTWLPKSKVTVYENTDEPEYCRSYIIVMPIWLAKAKGFWGYDRYGNPISDLVDEADIQAAGHNWKVH